ncbi:hypothetical protein GM661_08485 [Iocasia frigidifontis]|uniref:Uncharacterized protein n=1 Tax=Iocasia fonsfrigidae TaxID=2682810 RepID=A0A8A7KM87_9FIRM|nr:hypothetical protein D7D81_10910 [Halocella sp. SP3-1]QTL99957.1 hypothetical protein GM661_08485 [Iocasia fonsfrigidae]
MTHSFKHFPVFTSGQYACNDRVFMIVYI